MTGFLAKKVAHKAALLGLALLLPVFASGCGTSGKIGASDNALYSNIMPGVIIKANAPMKLMGNGKFMGGIKSDTTQEANASIYYAAFAESASGPLEREAHVFAVDMSSANSWAFGLDAAPPSGAFYQRKERIDSRDWSVQMRLTPANRDWVSALWRGNGREVPALWVVKRWTYTPAPDTRFVAEYRETVPACLIDKTTMDALARSETPYNIIESSVITAPELNPTCAAALKEFEKRADQAFTMQHFNAAEIRPQPAGGLGLPGVAFNGAELVGKVEAVSSSGTVPSINTTK